jgi:hypothetical protein
MLGVKQFFIRRLSIFRSTNLFNKSVSRIENTHLALEYRRDERISYQTAEAFEFTTLSNDVWGVLLLAD